MADKLSSKIAPQAVTEVAIAVVEHCGCVLIGQRPSGVPLAGFWEFPGGKVEAGELPAQAAVRECREEAGVSVDVLSRYPTQQYTYPHATLRLHFFRCQLATEATNPRAPFRWVPRGELTEYKSPPANSEILEQLLRPESRKE